MQKFWEGSVHVDAPAAEVWSWVSDFNRHPEWDRFTKEIELSKAGDELGVGSEWRVKEYLGMLKAEGKENWFQHGAAPGKREVRHVVPGQKVVWHTSAVPKIGISAVFTIEVIAEPVGTSVRQSVQLSVPGVVDVVGRVLVPKRDTMQQQVWQQSLDQLKALVEGSPVREAVAV